jgi:hypothetical protein
MNKLIYVQVYDHDDRKFLNVLNGQLVKHKSDTCLVINSNTHSFLNSLNCIKLEYWDLTTPELFLKLISLFKTKIQGYVLANSKDIYRTYNSIILDNRFLLVSFNQRHTDFFSDIQLVVKPNIDTDFDDFSVIYQDPVKNEFGLIDFAIANTLQMYWSTFPIHVNNTYGWSDTLCGCIPLEYLMINKMSSYGKYVFPSDSHENLAVMYLLDKLIKIEPYIPKIIVPKKNHAVAFVYTDGDNFNVPYYRMNMYLDTKRNFPVTWTIAPKCPKLYIKRAFDKSHPSDEFILGPSGFGYCFINQFPPLSESEHYRKTDKLAEEYGVNIVNEIHNYGFFNYLFGLNDYKKKNTYAYSNVLIYDAWNYCLKKNNYKVNGTKIFFANKSLYFDSEIKSGLLNETFNANEFSIVPVNLWKVSPDKLIEIADALSKKHNNIEFVNLSTVYNMFSD